MREVSSDPGVGVKERESAGARSAQALLRSALPRSALPPFLLLIAFWLAAGRGVGQDVETPSEIIPIVPPRRTLPPPGPFPSGSLLDSPDSSIEALKENSLKLQAARQALQRECWQAKNTRDAVEAEAPDNSQLKLRLGELLVKLNTPKARPAEITKPPAPVKQEKPVEIPKERIPPKREKSSNSAVLPEGPPPVNPAALGQALFKAENFEGALKAFRLVDLKGMRAEDRCPIQYLMAICLKRMGKMDEAATLFREIANVRGDENMAACAQWQLSALRWRQELANQLEDVRQRRKMLESQP
jgi:hypothetical protein